jgi:hypothetical protein
MTAELIGPQKGPGSVERAFGIAIGVLAVLVVVAGLVIFAAGEDLFGSDSGSIDSYNREVLDTCEVPADSTLVRTFVLPSEIEPGIRLRSMTYIYASPLSPDELMSFYDLDDPGVWDRVPDHRACRFGNQPEVIILEASTVSEDELPIPEINEIAAIPTDTRSFLLLRLAQREQSGIFDSDR